MISFTALKNRSLTFCLIRLDKLGYVKRVKVKWSRYRLSVVQRVGRGTALPFHDRGTRRGWVVSSTPRPHFTPGKDPVFILQEAGWSPGPIWRDGKSRTQRDSIPDRPACSQSLYRLSYKLGYIRDAKRKTVRAWSINKRLDMSTNNRHKECLGLLSDCQLLDVCERQDVGRYRWER